jgi:UDP-glucose 4-epimerase
MILLTGGAGYIGSHTALSLLESGEKLLILDNLDNSNLEVIDNIEIISKKSFQFVQGDVRDYSILDQIFQKYPINGVIHFAAYKAVGESVGNSLRYYDNNVGGLITLLKACKKYKVSNFIFSSSCTVYGNPDTIPVDEESVVKQAASPYGNTKIICEEILKDFSISEPWFKFVSLRYFNPVGAHLSGLIGDDPNGVPNNLLPFLVRVASGELDVLSVFGGDYNTPDGTAIRDYIHVVDLAEAHLSALKYVVEGKTRNSHFNIGTGKGYSVLDLINTFEKVTGVKINYKVVDRRPGDVEQIFAQPDLAKRELGWNARFGLEEMLSSAWNYQKRKKNV